MSRKAVERYVRQVLGCTAAKAAKESQKMSLSQTSGSFSGHVEKAVQLPFGSRESQNHQVAKNKDWTVNTSCRQAMSKATSVLETRVTCYHERGIELPGGYGP